MVARQRRSRVLVAVVAALLIAAAFPTVHSRRSADHGGHRLNRFTVNSDTDEGPSRASHGESSRRTRRQQQHHGDDDDDANRYARENQSRRRRRRHGGGDDDDDNDRHRRATESKILRQTRRRERESKAEARMLHREGHADKRKGISDKHRDRAPPQPSASFWDLVLHPITLAIMAVSAAQVVAGAATEGGGGSSTGGITRSDRDNAPLGQAIQNYRTLETCGDDAALEAPLLVGDGQLAESHNAVVERLAAATSLRQELVDIGGEIAALPVPTGMKTTPSGAPDGGELEGWVVLADSLTASDDGEPGQARSPALAEPAKEAAAAAAAASDEEDGADSGDVDGSTMQQLPTYADANTLPQYCERVVARVVREQGGSELESALRDAIQEEVKGQVRVSQKQKIELQEALLDFSHVAEARTTDLRNELDRVRRSQDEAVAELKQQRKQSMMALRQQINALWHAQRKALMDDLEKAYTAERQAHVDKFCFRFSTTLGLCALVFLLNVMSQVFEAPSYVSGQSFTRDVLIAAKCLVVACIAGFHTVAGRIAGNVGFVISGSVALAMLIYTKQADFLTMWTQSHFLFLAVTTPLLWCQITLKLAERSFARAKAAIEQSEWSDGDAIGEGRRAIDSTFAWAAVGNIDLKILVDDFAVPTLQYLLVLHGSCRLVYGGNCLDLLV
mmetsp:Transcript_15340/g.39485  ORF Transcript_15340/g.39485 Transcript_15340/m.39485 type:complete len:677 (-) Transcript_15340:136-2166(-)